MLHALFILLIILIIDLTAFTCILPLFPSILDNYSHNFVIVSNNNETTTLNSDRFFQLFDACVRKFQSVLDIPDVPRYNNVFFAGILGSMFSLLQYLSSPIFGALSDAFGRKPILLLSICGSLVSYYLWHFSAGSFTLFIVSRAVGGFSKASVSVAIAIVADVLPPHARGQGMALIGVAFSLAFIIGPAIGAYLSNYGQRSAIELKPSKFAIFATLIELSLVLLFLPETLIKRKMCLSQMKSSTLNYVLPTRIFKFSVVESLKNHKNSPNIILLRGYARLYFVYLFLYSAFEFTLCFLTHIRFDYDSVKQGRLYVFSGIIMIFIQGGYIRRIKLTHQRDTLKAGLSIIIPAFIIISVAYNEIMLYIGLALYAVASATVVPCLTTLVAASCDSVTKGISLGVFRSVGALARACGPFFGSFLFWLLGSTFCYALGAMMLFIPLLMLSRIPKDDFELQSASLLLKAQ